MITQQQLGGYVGKGIAEICQNAYTSHADNHCAHFVSHVIGSKFGTTCRMLGNGQGDAATLRAPQLFARCASVGVWSLRPASLTTCLVFMTRASNVNLAGKVMANAPRTHVGVFAGGFIWHYSNQHHHVVRQTPSQFARHYPAPDNAMFYGSLP